MIWGSQYDAMMNWMVKTGKKVGDSDTSKINTDSSKITGSSTVDEINNIYDLYGCHREWTSEAYNEDGRVLRGGYYNSTSSPAVRLSNNSDNISSYHSLRATLYIK